MIGTREQYPIEFTSMYTQGGADRVVVDASGITRALSTRGFDFDWFYFFFGGVKPNFFAHQNLFLTPEVLSYLASA